MKITTQLFTLSFILSSSHVIASELVYTPVNPSFGGNPLNSSYLLGTAAANNDYSGPKIDSGFEEKSALERLASSLESRLISQILSDASEGKTGQLITEAFTVNVVEGEGGALLIHLVDNLTGESSTIQVGGITSN
ncbi:curli production assembly protein CsgF [Moritella sp. F3]|nr:curli assembly protein CsgF [Moritella sp. F3]GIC79290.1 curli production assembly protein CsgF [Moritella sp. F1]GIC81953.1 curli production assembly protein CsgF [Moritella sp. F3]